MSFKINELHYYVQKVLPAVYDDTLSYYELLSKVLAKLNEVIDASNEYFSRDLSEYVGDILREWYENGELESIINQTVFSNLNGKIDDYGINVKEFGAVGDGVTDDTTAINNASIFVRQQGEHVPLFIPKGRYKITGTIKITNPLIGSEATLEYYGGGVALKIGDDNSPNVVTARKEFKLPRVINMLRTNGWDGTSEGVRTINLNTCHVYVPFIQDFEKGLVVYGYDGGNAYNTYHLGALWENHKNLVLDTTEKGYSNQNLFLNGRLQHSNTKGASLDDPNANQIQMSTYYGGGPNNNTFINTSFEGANVARYRVDMSGKYNMFLNCRWEWVGTKPTLIYRDTAQWNKIIGGYACQDIEEVFEGDLGGGSIDQPTRLYMRATNPTMQTIPDNTWTTVTGWKSNGRRITYDATTGKTF